MPSIELRAYNIIPGKIFVRVPNERGRWLITDISVAHVPCKHCGAVIGEPCFRIVQNRRSYTNGVHYVRKWDVKGTGLDAPKLRLRPEDLEDISDA